MNASKIIKNSIDSNEINKFFADKLIQAFGTMLPSDYFYRCLEFSKDLTKLGIDSEKDFKDAVQICDILFEAYGEIDSSIFSYAMKKRKTIKLGNINDYYYLVLKSVMKNKELKKVAYPMMMGALSEVAEEPYDLDKWSDIVHKIYDAVINRDMSFENALDYYAEFLDSKSGEDVKFKKWIKHFKDGEHLKYNIGRDS